ncbi:MAG: hypothetical protein GX432_00105 [Candidatus Atribacteria bacterium]|nr:hypothetical protein [Candidatus Atribacteria bacterium]
MKRRKSSKKSLFYFGIYISFFMLVVLLSPAYSYNPSRFNGVQASIVETDYQLPFMNQGEYRLGNTSLGFEEELSSSVAVNAMGYIHQSKPVSFQTGNDRQIILSFATVAADEEESQKVQEAQWEEGKEIEVKEEESGLSQYFQEGDFVTVQPFAFQAQGNGPIYGWTWLTKKGDQASWIFKLESEPIKVKAAALNFSLLVTNQVNGGSGYTSNPKVKIFDLNGNLLGSSTLYLVNTFRPKYSGNTVGIGYPASDAIEHSLIKQLVSQGQSFMVNIEWPAPDKNHFAAKKDSVLLAYVMSSEPSKQSDQNSREQKERK